MSEAAAATAELARVEHYLTLDAPNEPLRLRAIELSFATGDLAGARRHADALLAAHPASAIAAHRHSHVLLAEGRPQEAAAVLARLVEHNADAALQQDWALALYRSGDFDAAVPVCERIASREDASAAALGVCSLVFLDADKPEQARRASQTALAQDPACVEALVTRGSLALNDRNPDAARAAFGAVLAQHPALVRALTGLGSSYLIEGDAANAKPPLERASADPAAGVDTHIVLGWCRLMLKDPAQAADAFGKAAALDSTSAEAQGGLAVACALLGRRQEAEAAIAAAKNLDSLEPSIALAQSVLAQSNTEVRFDVSYIPNKTGRR